MDKKCKQCGADSRGFKFCCVRCKWTWHNHNRTLTPNVVGLCVICGKQVSRWESPARQRAETDKRIFCGRTCAGVGRMGKNHPAWKGGECTTANGYVWSYAPNHPHTTAKGYVYKHRLVMEKKLGRFLDPVEVVHHRDDDPSNNKLRNLKLYPNNAAHKADDAKRRKRDERGRLLPKGFK